MSPWEPLAGVGTLMAGAAAMVTVFRHGQTDAWRGMVDELRAECSALRDECHRLRRALARVLRDQGHL